MNLDEYRSRIARVVGMSSSDSDDLALIDDWVNEGVVQFLKDTKINQLTAVLAVTAGSGDYTLDTEILAFTDVWYAPSGGQEVVLEPVDSRDILQMRRNTTTAESTTRYYAMQGAHLLMLYPEPASSDDRLHIIYTPRPDAMSATSQSPSDSAKGNVPEEYHDVIEAYAKWKAAEAEEHRPSNYGLSFQAEYEKGIAKTRSDLNKKAGVFKSRKVGGKLRGRRFPVTPGTDIRGF